MVCVYGGGGVKSVGGGGGYLKRSEDSLYSSHVLKHWSIIARTVQIIYEKKT